MSDPTYRYDGWIDRWCFWVDVAWCIVFVGAALVSIVPCLVVQRSWEWMRRGFTTRKGN